MTDNKSLIEAAKLLQKNCEQNNAKRNNSEKCNCDFYKNGCIFINNYHYADGMPTHWEIPASRRFASKDIALAKAVKAFGYTHIERIVDGECCIAWDDESGEGVDLPSGAFASIEFCESILIDDIIKEGE